MNALIEAIRRRHELVRSGGERGTTLLEMMVAMGIMTICGSIFTGAVVLLDRTTSRTMAVTTAATDTNIAYLELDKTVRYAAVVTNPGRSTVSGSWYVELRHDSGGAEVCTQLRLDRTNRRLERRTWLVASPGTTLTQFRQIAPSFTNSAAAPGSADQPFVLEASSANSTHQQLTVNLTAQSGPAGNTASSRSRFTLTALNSPGQLPADPVCNQAGRP